MMLLWCLLNGIVANLIEQFYCFIREAVHAVRDVIWWINGTHAAIRNSRKDGNFDSCVQVLGILGRYKKEDIAMANFITDFILCHDRFEDPSYLLRSEISLYCITPREFVFVQCRDGDTAWDVKDFAFSRHGQHQKAVKVLLLPIHAAHRLAAELEGRPKQKLIFILNIGRCGSTLACQIFQDTGRCVAYSEPAVFSDFVKDHFNPHENDPESDRLIKTAVTLLCKPSAAKGTMASHGIHALKLQPMITPIMPLIKKLFPDSSCIFLYRGIRATCLSYGMNQDSGSIQMVFLYMVSFKLLLRFFISHGLWSPHIPYPEAVAAGLAHPLSVFPVSATRDYLDLCEKEIPNLCAIRYEDLVRQPFELVSRVFQFCGLPQSCVQLALRNLDRDSQANSALAKKQKGNSPKATLSVQQLAEIQILGTSLGVPDILNEPFILPGTIQI